MKQKILVIIPIYNCEKQIPRLLSKFDSDIQSYIHTIIIINNRSHDNSENIAIDCLKHITNVDSLVLRNEVNYGYGGSLKIGFEFARRHSFDWVIAINGDDQSPITDFLPMLKSHEYEKYDVMWGSRFLKDSRIRNYSFFRIMANHVFNISFSLVLGKPIHDIGCGVYMYSVKILKQRFYLSLPDVLYIGTFLRLAHDFYKHKLSEFPLSWNSDDQASSVKAISQTLAQFKLALQYLFYKSKFFLKDHRSNKIEQYISQVVFASSSTKYELNSHNEFLVSCPKVISTMNDNKERAEILEAE